MSYTIRRIGVKDLNGKVLRFIGDAADHLNRTYGNRYNWSTFPIKHAVDKHLWLMCFRGDEPVGFMFGTINLCIWDLRRTTLRQETLYAKYPRATVALLQHFIDFGKQQSNDVIACVGEHTNLKASSLKKLGFTKMDELYRLEV